MTGAVFVAGTRACFRFFATAALLQSRTDGSIRKSVRSEEIASQTTTSLRVAIGRPPARLLIGPGHVPPRLRREAEALEREAAEEPTRDVAFRTRRFARSVPQTVSLASTTTNRRLS